MHENAVQNKHNAHQQNMSKVSSENDITPITGN